MTPHASARYALVDAPPRDKATKSPMGPMLMTGLACLGTAVGLGLLVSGTWRPVDEPVDRRVPTGRSLAIILMAFCESFAILGVIAGLLAILVVKAVHPGDGIFAAALGILGTVIGLGLVASQRRMADPVMSMIAGSYIAGVGVLGIVVAVLANVIVESGTRSLTEWPFVITGLISGASALAIGVIGGPAIQSMQGADPATSKAIVNAQIFRCLPFQVAGIGASVVAILLMVLD
jgi:F0F1-type ATP synthase membrane subunit c/vacuolar-type H+-ATPase subunit K